MARASESGYDGVPYDELEFEHIDWTHRGEYIRTRSQRKGPAEFDVEPQWAATGGESTPGPRHRRHSADTTTPNYEWTHGG